MAHLATSRWQRLFVRFVIVTLLFAMSEILFHVRVAYWPPSSYDLSQQAPVPAVLAIAIWLCAALIPVALEEARGVRARSTRLVVPLIFAPVVLPLVYLISRDLLHVPLDAWAQASWVLPVPFVLVVWKAAAISSWLDSVSMAVARIVPWRSAGTRTRAARYAFLYGIWLRPVMFSYLWMSVQAAIMSRDVADGFSWHRTMLFLIPFQAIAHAPNLAALSARLPMRPFWPVALRAALAAVLAVLFFLGAVRATESLDQRYLALVAFLGCCIACQVIHAFTNPGVLRKLGVFVPPMLWMFIEMAYRLVDRHSHTEFFVAVQILICVSLLVRELVELRRVQLDPRRVSVSLWWDVQAKEQQHANLV